MRFIIITNAPTLKKNGNYYSYAPYVNEINIWSKLSSEIGILSPISYNKELLLAPFQLHPTIFPIKSISFVSFLTCLASIFKIPTICIQIYKAMKWADHIHLRCPGNIGLLGCFVQILFPKKSKTAKYAGNWDPNSKQPLSYKLQKWILSNTFLTRNCKVLVYGEWPNQSKNIVPFFTASYSEKEGECHPEPVEGAHELEANDEILKQVQHDKPERHPQSCTEQRRSVDRGSHDLGADDEIATSLTPRNDNFELVEGVQTTKLKFIYVGGLTPGKQPLLSVEVVHKLKEKGYQVQLDIYGDGVERKSIENYIAQHDLKSEIILHGNTSKEIVKEAYKKAHFLVFISKSEGWPKVVAEAMFWGCVPITSKVSCIEFMLGEGTRGTLVRSSVEDIIQAIEHYLTESAVYTLHAKNAMNWSRQYTLEKFEIEIGTLLE